YELSDEEALRRLVLSHRPSPGPQWLLSLTSRSGSRTVPPGERPPKPTDRRREKGRVRFDGSSKDRCAIGDGRRCRCLHRKSHQGRANLNQWRLCDPECVI